MKTDVSSSPGRPSGMKQWSECSELTFGPRFWACIHSPLGCLWVTQMSAPPTPARAPAHEVERLAVRGDPRLLIDGIAVDGIGQSLGRRPVRARPGPLTGLADP